MRIDPAVEMFETDSIDISASSCTSVPDTDIMDETEQPCGSEKTREYP